MIPVEVIQYSILPFLDHYDVFRIRYVNKWWYDQYRTIRDEFLEGEGSIMTNILKWNDPDLLKEILRVCGEDDLFDIIEIDQDVLFDNNHNALVDELLQYQPFVKYTQDRLIRIYNDGMDIYEEEYTKSISRYVVSHPNMVLLLGDDPRVWTTIMYGMDNILSDMEDMIDIIEEHQLTLDSDRTIDDFGDLYEYDGFTDEENHTWELLKRRILSVNNK